MARSLQVASIAGTAVRLHWTFLLLMLGIFGVVLFTTGVGEALHYTALILAMFGCVVLHEFGHIRVARIFGIETHEVMLLPIGGIAKLERIPEEPAQELAIAIAGPAVNFLLFAGLLLALGRWPEWEAIALLDPSQISIIEHLALFNLIVGLFNLLPAFPMDGGRILRAALAFVLPRHRATSIAAWIAQCIAIGMGLLALNMGSIILAAIAAFVFIAARSEAHVDNVRHAIGGTPITHLMVTGQPRLNRTDLLGDAARAIIHTDNDELPVFDTDGQLAGILLRDDLLKALEKHGPQASVSVALTNKVALIPSRSRAEKAAELIENGAPAVGIIDDRGRFLGIVNWRNTLDAVAVRKALERRNAKRLRVKN